MSDFAFFMTALVSGLAVGASFSLIGSGFVIVHRVTHVVNFTQGSLAVIAGMLASRLITMGVPHGAGELVAVLVAGLVGLAYGAITLGRPGTPPFVALLITLGLVFVTTGANIALFGEDPATSVPLLPGIGHFGGLQFEWQRVLVIIVTAVVFAGLALFFERTDLGRAMTATASNPRAARLVGISTRRMGLVSFAVGGLLGGIAGVLIAPFQQITPYSDMALAVSGFAAAVFGGLSSPWLTLAGGLLLGVLGQMMQAYWSGSYQTQISLLLMLVIMIVRAGALTRTEEAK